MKTRKTQYKFVAVLVVLTTVVALTGPFSDAGSSRAFAAPPAASGTQMISISSTSPPQSGDRNSRNVVLSADGHWAAYSSSAYNIGPSRATAGISQIYLYNIQAGTTEVISAAGAGEGNGDSTTPSISADGSSVAFVSKATNLVPIAKTGISQIFVWSRGASGLKLASISADVVPIAGNDFSYSAALSGDGRKVAFTSGATNLTSLSTTGKSQVYVRDLMAGVTSMVSVDPAVPGSGASSVASSPAISADGGAVAFVSAASLTPLPTHGKSQIYVRHLSTATTELVSVDSTGTQAGSGDSTSLSLSSDGTVVAFSSTSNGLDPLGSNGFSQIYRRDLNTKATRLVSVDGSGTHPANAPSDAPSITPDGQIIAYASNATDLVPETASTSTLGMPYVYTAATNSNTLGCTASGGTPCNNSSEPPSVSGDGSLIAFASDATDLVPDIESRNTQVFLRNMTAVPRVDRIGGADRFAVSAATSSDAFSTGVPIAYVASGGGFADALAGSAAAAVGRGPLLLIAKDSIPVLVGIELHRLKPRKIVVLGGTASVDPIVMTALETYAPNVARIGGADRYEVAAAVSASTFPIPSTGAGPTVYVASGEVFPDALSGSAVAGKAGGPVLLVRKDSVPAPIIAELGRLKPRGIVVLGGPNSISQSVVDTLSDLGATSRIGGIDRFAVSAAVSATSFPTGTHTVYIASGAVFPDALSGSAAAVQNRGPVLLVAPDAVPPAVASELTRLGPTRIVILGGTNTVSSTVKAALETYLHS